MAWFRVLVSTVDSIVAAILMTRSSSSDTTSNFFRSSSVLSVKSSPTVCRPGGRGGMNSRLDDVEVTSAPSRCRFAESMPSTGSGGPRFLVASSKISVRDRIRRSTFWWMRKAIELCGSLYGVSIYFFSAGMLSVPFVDIDEKESSRLLHRFYHNTELWGHWRVG
jgi:hypothetical protein